MSKKNKDIDLDQTPDEIIGAVVYCKKRLILSVASALNELSEDIYFRYTDSHPNCSEGESYLEIAAKLIDKLSKSGIELIGKI